MSKKNSASTKNSSPNNTSVSSPDNCKINKATSPSSINLWQKLKLAFLADRRNYCLLIILLIIATLLRFYNFRAGMMFQDDQARDAFVVANIFLHFDPVFIGPVTSIGNMYLGPFYYYLMLPALALTYPDPIGPAVLIGLLSILTIFLSYQLGKSWLSKKSAFFATGLMTFSMMLIQYSRFSWNPNPAPLLIVILLWAIWAAYQQNRTRAWWLVGICLAILTQLHYVYLLAVGITGLWWLVKIFAQKPDTRKFWSDSVIMIAIMLLSLIPQLLFDYKHDWLNLRALGNLFAKEQAFTPSATSFIAETPLITTVTQSTSGLNFFQILQLRTSQIFGELVLGSTPATAFLGLSPSVWLALVAVVILGLLLYFSLRYRHQPQKSFAPRLLFSFLTITLLGISLYQHSVYAHYLLFLIPIIFYAFGFLLDQLAQHRFWGKTSALLIFLLLITINWQNAHQNFIWDDQGMTADQAKKVASAILDHVSPNETYGLVTVKGAGLGTAYRYFLSTFGQPPLALAGQEIPDKLFIIDEGRDAKAALSDSSWDIVVYPTKIISNTLHPLATDGNDLPIYILEKNSVLHNTSV